MEDAKIKAAQDVFNVACSIFESYLAITKNVSRSTWNGKSYDYSNDTMASDTVFFASVFASVWSAIDENHTPAFDYFFEKRNSAFELLADIVRPSQHYPKSRLWVQLQKDFEQVEIKKPVEKDTIKHIGAVLRNSTAHFTTRFLDVSPQEYFSKLALGKNGTNLTVPQVVPEPDLKCNARIFLISWDVKYKQFNEPRGVGSNVPSRMIETHYAQLRYCLFRFLVDLFKSADHAFEDFLSKTPIE